MSNKLCKYFKICTCRCSGEADEVGEINELCDIGNLYHKLEKIKEYALSCMTGLACRHILNIIEGVEDEQ